MVTRSGCSARSGGATLDRALRHRRRAAVALAVGLLGGAVATTAAPAQATPGHLIVFKRDARNDVRILPGVGPGAAARTSIDLRSFTLVEQAGGVRMTVKLGRILPNSKYDQLVEVQMKPADSAETWFLDVSMSGHEPTAATATYSKDLSGAVPETCEPLVVTVDPVASTMSLVVPDQCLPTTAAKIRVYSSLSADPSVGAGFSVDKLAVRGGYEMHE